MNKTISINLGGLVFQIDEEAYIVLETYLTSLKQQFTDESERDEIVQDIEYRLAELFSKNLQDRKQEVVGKQQVEEVIQKIGMPDEIEENAAEKSSEQKSGKKVERKLFRDPDDKIVGGVLAGLSAFLGINQPLWLRLITVILVIAGVGSPVLIYLILWVLMPEAKTTSDKLMMKGTPVNIDNIQEMVKKKINNPETATGLVRFLQKTIQIIGAIILFFIRLIVGLVVFALGISLVATVFALGLCMVLFLVKGIFYIHLLFDSVLLFVLAVIGLLLTIGIPIFVLLYSILKIVFWEKIHLGGTLIIAALAWFLGLIALSVPSAYTISGFQSSAEQISVIELPNPSTEHLQVDVYTEDLVTEEKLFLGGNWMHIDGMEIIPYEKIRIDRIQLNIEMSPDTSFYLTAKKMCRGKDQMDAQHRLDAFVHDVEIRSENHIAISSVLELTKETKWRDQKMIYTLKVPAGSNVQFNDDIDEMIKQVPLGSDQSLKDLPNNTWRMTTQGFVCVSCQQ